MNAIYTEWGRFTMQLQLFVLCAMEELRRKGVAVRRRGMRVESRVGRHWAPLCADTAEIANL
jgi:hypothetical protein